MPKQAIKFSLNHMVCPRYSARKLIETAADLGIQAVELRNDVRENSITALDEAREIGALAKALDIEVLSINALYPFNIWNEERAAQAETLAELAHACGARGLVLCPLVDGNYRASEDEKLAGLKEALQALNPILEKYGLKGYVEPLGFPISSLRSKRLAVDTIKSLGLEDRFGLVHDTFHHCGAGESEFFAGMTGLVHISGVEDKAISFDDMLDAHRLLVGPGDRLDSVGQISQLLESGYERYISFEPFAKDVCELDDPIPAVKASIDYINQRLAS